MKFTCPACKFPMEAPVEESDLADLTLSCEQCGNSFNPIDQKTTDEILPEPNMQMLGGDFDLGLESTNILKLNDVSVPTAFVPNLEDSQSMDELQSELEKLEAEALGQALPDADQHAPAGAEKVAPSRSFSGRTQAIPTSPILFLETPGSPEAFLLDEQGNKVIPKEPETPKEEESLSIEDLQIIPQAPGAVFTPAKKSAYRSLNWKKVALLGSGALTALVGLGFILYFLNFLPFVKPFVSRSKINMALEAIQKADEVINSGNFSEDLSRAEKALYDTYNKAKDYSPLLSKLIDFHLYRFMENRYSDRTDLKKARDINLQLQLLEKNDLISLKIDSFEDLADGYEETGIGGLTQVLKQNENDFLSRYYLLQSLIKLQRLKEAANWVKKTNLRFSMDRIGRAQVAILNKETQPVDSLIKNAISKVGDNVRKQALFLLSLKPGDLEESNLSDPTTWIGTFEKTASKLQLSSLYHQIGEYYKRGGRLDQWVFYVAKAAELSPQESYYPYALAAYFSETSNRDQFMVWLSKLGSSTSQSIPVVVMKKYILSEKGKVYEGISQLKSLKKDNPTSTVIDYHIAYQNYNVGQYEEAEKILSPLVKRDHVFLGKSHQLLGKVNLELGKQAEALENFKKSLEMDDTLYGSYQLLAAVYLENRDFEKAIKTIDDGLTKNSDFSYLYSQQGEYFKEIGETEKAKSALTTALQKDGENIDALNTFGAILTAEGKSAEALASYQKVLELQADNLIANLETGKIYLKQAHSREEAEKNSLPFLARAQKVASSDEETNRWNGELREFLGKYDEALDFYAKAIKASEPTKYYKKKLGFVFTQLGRLREAETQLKEALAMDTFDPETYDLLAKGYLQMFDLGSAEKIYLEKLVALGESGFTQADLAKVYGLAGKKDQAAAYYQKAILTLSKEKTPTRSMNEVICSSYLYLGQRDMDKYTPAMAIERYKRAQVLCPKQWEIHKFLGHAYRLLGDELKSLEHFSEYVSVAPDAPDIENIQAMIVFLEKSLVSESERGEVAKN